MAASLAAAQAELEVLLALQPITSTSDDEDTDEEDRVTYPEIEDYDFYFNEDGTIKPISSDDEIEETSSESTSLPIVGSSSSDLDENCTNEERSQLRNTVELNGDLHRLNIFDRNKLDEIEIDGSWDFFFAKLPSEFRNLRTTLLKASLARRYDIIPGDLISNILNESNAVIPELLVGTKGTVFISNYDQQLHSENFFVQWKLQEDRLFLINRWLTDLVEFRKLNCVKMLTEDLTYKMVVAPLPDSIVDGCNSSRSCSSECQVFGRGFVKKVSSCSGSATEIEIYFVDFGSQQTFGSLDNLWVAPREIADLRPLCFNAHLISCEPNIETDEENKKFKNIKFQEISAPVQDLTTLIEECLPSWNQTEGLVCQILTVRKGTICQPISYGVQLWKYKSQNFGLPVPVSILLNVDLDSGYKGQFQIPTIIEITNSESASIPTPTAQTKTKTPEKPPVLTENCKPLCQKKVSDPQPIVEPNFVLQLAYQLYVGESVEVKPYSETDYLCLRHYKVQSIVTPGEFQCQCVTNDGGAFDWWQEMQMRCDTNCYRATFRVRGHTIIKGRFYAWRDGADETWNRVEMVEPFCAKLTSKAWEVDRGRYVRVRVDNLLELDPKFCAAPALAFKAHLIHVEPFTPATNKFQDQLADDQQWCEESTEMFKNLCPSDKVFYGIILETKECSKKEKANYRNGTSFGIVLAEQSSIVGTVQSALVKKDLAVATGPSAGLHDLAWTEFLNSEEVSRTELKLQLVKMLPHDYYQSLSEDLRRRKIPDAMKYRMGCVWISSVGKGPSRFYIMMENKCKEFKKMAKELNHTVNTCNLPCMSPKDVKPGMVVIAKALDEVSFNSWARVVILSIKKESKTSVAYVACIDTGDEFLVNLKTVRKLMKNFEQIPPFCQRVHLEITSADHQILLSRFGSEFWTHETNSIWRRFITAWNGKGTAEFELKSRAYFAWQPNENVVKFEKFNQELAFNGENELITLEASDGSNVNKSYPAVDRKREDPLLKQFYTSIGISLVYEKVGPKFFEFVPIFQFLQNGAADGVTQEANST